MGQIIFHGKKVKENVLNGNVYARDRFVHLMLGEGMHKRKKGIYRLWIGDYFYIGRATNIRARAKQHMQQLELSLAKGVVANKYQSGMLDVLIKNPELSIIKVEVLQECEDHEMYEKEKLWLSQHHCSVFCLNETDRATRTHNDKVIESFVAGTYIAEYKIETLQDYKDFLKKMKDKCVTGFVLKSTQ